ncbi:MAG TPA: carbon-nitrogen hydrolase family protein [Candidatus Acidoferrales bacterium]|nr:carbon-nitrogen hydrolase family protein [Candidatus Acidoferrales bacterium]
MKTKVAVAQIRCQLGKPDANLKTIHNLSVKAAKSGPDILCFPELATTGYSLNVKWRKFSETIPGQTSERLASIAREYGFHLVCGMPELDAKSGRIFDSSILFDPDGEVVGAYRKIHLWNVERRYFTPGKRFKVFDTKIGKIGLGVCYDLEFPESARALALEGAEIIIYSSAQPHPMETHVDTYIRSRAGENCVYVCHSNRIGKEGGTMFFGHSQIVSPECRVLAKLGREQGFAAARLDLGMIQKLSRSKLPYLRQRVPSAYSSSSM